MSPPDAERVARRVGVHLVPLLRVEVRSCLQQPGAKRSHLFVSSSRIEDVQVEMKLLGYSVRPLRRKMIRRELYADAPLTRGVDDAVEALLFEDVSAEDSSPERALGMNVGRIEHDHLAHHVHDAEISAGRGYNPATGSGAECMAGSLVMPMSSASPWTTAPSGIHPAANDLAAGRSVSTGRDAPA